MTIRFTGMLLALTWAVALAIERVLALNRRAIAAESIP